MRINILLFATLKDRVGERQITLQFDNESAVTVSDILEVIMNQYPQLKPHANNILVSVNHEFSERDFIVKPEDEIALFPPVSGG